MDIRELKTIIDHEVEGLKDHQKLKVLIAVKGSGIGGTSCEPVISANSGFDWDSGKFIFRTERLLSNKKFTKQQQRIIELENLCAEAMGEQPKEWRDRFKKIIKRS